jgi:hypothetical protein
MSSNSQKRIRRIREVTQGTTPGTAMAIVPFERFKLASPVSREEPGNTQSDRQVADNPETDVNITGSASTDFLLTQHWEMKEEAFDNTRSAVATTGSLSISAVASGNKITRASGSFVSDGFLAGQLAQVTGLSTNGAHFLALITAVAALELTIDTNFKTLVNEGPVASCVVKHDSNLTLGTSMLTATYEEYNTSSGKGMVYRGVGVNDFGVEGTYPTRMKETYGLVGMTIGERVSAALVNSSTAALTRKIVNFNKNFGDGANPTFGYGFRYAGALMPNLRIKKLGLKLTNPLLADGGAGHFGPQDLTLDGRFKVMLDLEVLRNTSDAEDLIDDALDPATEASIGFGVRDRSGKRGYYYMPLMHPIDSPDISEAQQSGRETIGLKFVASLDSVHTMLRYAEFL